MTSVATSQVSTDSQINGFLNWAASSGVLTAPETMWEHTSAELPAVTLPSHTVTISQCAEELFRLIGDSKRLFMRDRTVVLLAPRDDGMLALEILRPAAARSLFEKFARLFAWRSGARGELVLKPVNCPHEMADALLQSEEAGKSLPRVQALLNCPVLRESGGVLDVAGPGYDAATRMLITGGKIPPMVELTEAISALEDLFAEFDFQTEGDRARAIASLISPALQTGGFLRGRVPADIAEADQSQSGKTYRQKVIAAIYNEQVSLVTNRQGGVGSVDESLNQQLVAGRPFIQFDNFRGRFDSAHTEAFMTAERSFSCRVPYGGNVHVAPEGFFIFMTSNGVDTTRDFANRSNIIRIRKKPPGHQFRRFPEGDLLARVRHWQPYYLGCVFAVVRAWHAAGKPRSNETEHDFRDWVQVVDWILQYLFKTVPVMSGHRQAQERVSNPALVWMRNVALAVKETGELDRALTATDLFNLCEGADIAIPGLRSSGDQDKGKKVIGTIMSKLFRDENVLNVDGFTITREERYLTRDDAHEGGSFKSKTYTVSCAGQSAAQSPQQPQ